MAFSDKLKLHIKKKSHFSCCLCKSMGVEIHHIIPQAEGGSDTEDNAAPLCPSCHEIYGANPQKRKFIREARDFWFELCSQRFNSDDALLKKIEQRIEQTVTKTDLEDFIETLSNMFSSDSIQTSSVNKDEDNMQKLLEIQLPIKYWIVTLFGLDTLVKGVKIKAGEMQKEGFNLSNLENMPEEERIALAGPIITRGIIIDVLVKNGIMTDVAQEKLGIPFVNRLQKKGNELIKKGKS